MFLRIYKVRKSLEQQYVESCRVISISDIAYKIEFAVKEMMVFIDRLKTAFQMSEDTDLEDRLHLQF